MKALKGKKSWAILTALVLILGLGASQAWAWGSAAMRDLLKVLLIKGIILLCKFIDWREQREQRYPALEQDW